MRILLAVPACAVALATGGPVLAAEAPGPDEFALRYYASLDQRARVNAEIFRLQRLYPAFEPPADLYGAPSAGGGDEQALWELFASDRLDELRDAIAARQKDMPGWRPSADILQKLQRKELRKEVVAYRRDGRWQDLVAFARERQIADADVDVLWSIAEAFARTGQAPEAVAIYKTIMNSNKDRHIRIATVQKAMGLLRMADVEALVALDAKGPDGASEFQTIAIDLTRARIAAFLRDERPDEIAREALAQLEDHARGSRDANQLGLIAWYSYKRRDFHGALEWFKLAIQNGGDAVIAHGLAHTLRALDMRREAEEVAFAWREPLVNNRILFIDLLERELTRETPPFVEPERLARYARETMETSSGEGAQALAWYAYNSCQFDVALTWFERAVAWFPKEATVYGYALTAKRLRKGNAFLELVNRYDGLFPRVVELLFPDNYYHPRTPCDRSRSAMLHGAAVKMGAYVVPGPASNALAAISDRDPYAGAGGVVAQRPSRATEKPAFVRLSKSLRGRFPIPVAPENPLRSRSLAQGAGRSPAIPPSAAAPIVRPDQIIGPRPLVARRVPGVGPMPYERYGFSLLPGWNGVDRPTWPPASDQIAPAGTQWANADADPARTASKAQGAGPAAQASQPVSHPSPSVRRSASDPRR